MYYHFSPNKPIGFVSDAAAKQVDEIFSSNRPTLASVYDLLEFAHLSVLSEDVLVTPAIYENARWLHELDFVHPLNLEISEGEVDKPESTDVIEINLENGKFVSYHPLGDLALTLLSSMKLRGLPGLSSLTNPSSRESEPNASGRLRLLPLLMMTIQMHRNILPFEDEVARATLTGKLKPVIDDYTQFSVSLDRLNQHWGIETLTSVLEQPLTTNLLVENSLSFTRAPEFEKEVKTKLRETALAVPNRREFFQKWRIPPLGLIALAKAQSLEDVPKAIVSSREKFHRLRTSISKIKLERIQYVDAVNFETVGGEQASRDLGYLDKKLKEALESFDHEVQRRRSYIDRTELLFNLFDFAIQIVGGLGVGSLEFLVKKLGLKKRAILHRIPGLFKAASVITENDSLLALEWLDRIVPQDDIRYSERILLDLAFGHASHYCQYEIDQFPEEFSTFNELTDRQIWLTLVRSREILDMWLDGAFKIK